MTEGKAGQQHQHIALLQWSAAEKYAQHLLICINFPGPGLQVEVVRIITCLLSPITSRLTYPEQSANISEGARLTFHIIWSSGAHFPLISSELGTEQTHQWKQSGEAREVLAESHRSQARKSLEECFLLSCRLPSGIWQICQSASECCQFVISTLPVPGISAL